MSNQISQLGISDYLFLPRQPIGRCAWAQAISAGSRLTLRGQFLSQAMEKPFWEQRGSAEEEFVARSMMRRGRDFGRSVQWDTSCYIELFRSGGSPCHLSLQRPASFLCCYEKKQGREAANDSRVCVCTRLTMVVWTHLIGNHRCEDGPHNFKGLLCV